MRFLPHLSAALLLAVVTPALAEEGHYFYLYRSGGLFDSTSVVLITPADSAKADTTRIGGSGQKLFGGGVFFWDSTRVNSELVDYWIGPDIATAALSPLQGVMFGRTSVVDGSIRWLQLVSHVVFDTLAIDSTLFVRQTQIGVPDNPDGVYNLTTEDLWLDDIWTVPDSVLLELGGSRSFASLTVSDVEVAATGTVTFSASAVQSQSVNVAVPGAEIDDIAIVSINTISWTVTSNVSMWLYRARVSSAGNLRIVRTLIDPFLFEDFGDGSRVETVNWILFKKFD
jgi:hypothetical protein